MAHGALSLPNSTSRSCREHSPDTRELPEGTPTTGFRGCQSPTDSLFDPRSCQSPMDRFFEGPQMPSFFCPTSQSNTGMPSGCAAAQGSVLSQGTSSNSASMVSFGSVGFGAWPVASNTGPRMYLCPTGAIGAGALPIATLPAAVGVPSNGMSVPLPVTTRVPGGIPVALSRSSPQSSVQSPDVGRAAVASAATHAATQAVAQAMRAQKGDRFPESQPLTSALRATASLDFKASAAHRPPCPTAIYVDLTCLRDKSL
mmetsp:Transcript_16442/g.38530  ORF Transcript_16442/g.38530 Transcript_16442/m.38530 type:complete len:257 (-) Transcript_16442:340-1110(-)